MKLYQRVVVLLLGLTCASLLVCYRGDIPGYKYLIAQEHRTLVAHRSTHEVENREIPDSRPPVTVKDSSPSISNTIPAHTADVSNSSSLYNKIFVNPGIDLDKEQFTIAILTFRRVALLKIVIPHYCATGPKLNKIIIIWNDVGSPIPDHSEISRLCDVPLVFIQSKENKLTNRFIPYPEIETDGMLSLSPTF